MAIELSKNDKKIARELIEKSMQKEFQQGLLKLDKILQHWKRKLTTGKPTKKFIKRSPVSKNISPSAMAMRAPPPIFLYYLHCYLMAPHLLNKDLNGLSTQVHNAVLFLSKGKGVLISILDLDDLGFRY